MLDNRDIKISKATKAYDKEEKQKEILNRERLKNQVTVEKEFLKLQKNLERHVWKDAKEFRRTYYRLKRSKLARNLSKLLQRIDPDSIYRLSNEITFHSCKMQRGCISYDGKNYSDITDREIFVLGIDRNGIGIFHRTGSLQRHSKESTRLIGISGCNASVFSHYGDSGNNIPKKLDETINYCPHYSGATRYQRVLLVNRKRSNNENFFGKIQAILQHNYRDVRYRVSFFSHEDYGSGSIGKIQREEEVVSFYYLTKPNNPERILYINGLRFDVNNYGFKPYDICLEKHVMFQFAFHQIDPNQIRSELENVADRVMSEYNSKYKK